MSIIQGADANAEQAAEGLTSLTAVVIDANSTLATVCGTFDSETSSWTRAVEEVRQESEALNTGLASAHAGVTQVHNQAQDALESLNSSADEGDGDLSQMITILQETRSDSPEILQEAHTTMDAALQGLQQAATAAATEAETALSEIQSLQQSVEEKFSGYGEGVGQVREQMTAAASTLEESIQTVSDETSGEHQQEAVDAIQNFTTEIEGTIKSEFEQALTESGETFSEAFETLGTSLQEVYDDFVEKLGQVSDEVKGEIGDRLATEVQRHAETIVQKAVEDFLTSIGEDMVVMTVGTNVTTVMSPILPELMVAEKVLVLFNKAVQAMSLGTA